MPIWSQLLLLVVGGGIVLAFAWGGKGHFESEKAPPGAVVISVLSALSFLVFAVGLFSAERSLWVIIGLVLQVSSLALFLAAVRATRRTRITLIGDDDAPRFVVAHGPYRWVRHPFYVSYIVYWAACAIMVQTIPSMIAFLVMTGLYVRAGLLEEAKFRRSDIAEQYRQYQSSAGFLWPKI